MLWIWLYTHCIPVHCLLALCFLYVFKLLVGALFFQLLVIRECPYLSISEGHIFWVKSILGWQVFVFLFFVFFSFSTLNISSYSLLACKDFFWEFCWWCYGFPLYQRSIFLLLFYNFSLPLSLDNFIIMSLVENHSQLKFWGDLSAAQTWVPTSSKFGKFLAIISYFYF